jgi:hypothetical protein
MIGSALKESLKILHRRDAEHAQARRVRDGEYRQRPPQSPKGTPKGRRRRPRYGRPQFADVPVEQRWKDCRDKIRPLHKPPRHVLQGARPSRPRRRRGRLTICSPKPSTADPRCAIGEHGLDRRKVGQIECGEECQRAAERVARQYEALRFELERRKPAFDLRANPLPGGEEADMTPRSTPRPERQVCSPVP